MQQIKLAVTLAAVAATLAACGTSSVGGARGQALVAVPYRAPAPPAQQTPESGAHSPCLRQSDALRPFPQCGGGN